MPRPARFALALAALVPAAVIAGSVVLPHSFSNGVIADANEVNANFTALATAVNDNDARLDTFTFNTGNVAVGGSFKVADDATACSAARAGSLRYRSGKLEFCDGGTQWRRVVLGGGRDGSDANNPGTSCQQIKTDGFSQGSRLYWLDPGQTGSPANAFEAFCDMTTDASYGWTRLAILRNGGAPQFDLRNKNLPMIAMRAENVTGLNRTDALLGASQLANDTTGITSTNGWKIMIGQPGGYGIYNTGQAPCSWSSCNGMIGAGYTGSCGTTTSYVVGQCSGTSGPNLTASFDVAIYVR